MNTDRSPSPAYRAARERAAFRRRHERGTLRVTGKDRLDWLQGLLTNDVKSFDGAGWSYAAWLTPQGRMITDMSVIETGDEAWLDVPAPLARSLAEKFDLMIFAEDVRIEESPIGSSAWRSTDRRRGRRSPRVLTTDVGPVDRGGLAIVHDGSDPIVIVRTRAEPDGFVL